MSSVYNGGRGQNKVSDHPILVSAFRKNTSYYTARSSHIPLDFFSSVTPLWHVLYTLIVTCISLKLDYFLVSKLLVILFFFFPPHLFLTGQIIIALQSLVPGSPPAQPLLFHTWTGVPVQWRSREAHSWRSLHLAGSHSSRGAHICSPDPSAHVPVRASMPWERGGWRNEWSVSVTWFCM